MLGSVIACGVALSFSGAVAVVDAGPYTLALEKGVAATGAAVVDDADLQGAFAAVGASCFDVECLAKVALLADAEAVVYAAPREGGLDVVAVDSVPRVGRAHSASTGDDDIAAAVAAALAARLTPPPPSSPPPPPSPLVSSSPPVVSSLSSSPSSSRPPAAEGPSVAVLGGAGLVGAGAVALALGGVAGWLGLDSVSRADRARFQDDSAALAGEANARFWLAGGVGALGAAAVAGGVALLLAGPLG